MASKKMQKLAVTLSGVVLASLAFAGNAFAGSDCGGACIEIPANRTTTTTTTSSEESYTKVVVRIKTVEKIRHYEKSKNVVVAVNKRPNGVRSHKGCVNPVAKGWVRVGGSIINTDKYRREFPDTWKMGRKLCRPHLVRKNGGLYMTGDKDDCGQPVFLPMQAKAPKVIKKVVSFRTERDFLKVYERWVKKTSTKTETRNESTQLSCPDASWTLVGTMCKKCPPICPPVQPRECRMDVTSRKDIDLYTAYGSATVSAGGTVKWNWGDGNSSTGTSVSNTYSVPPPSNEPGAGVWYTISATAHFADGRTVPCGEERFFVAAPPLNGNNDPPPLP